MSHNIDMGITSAAKEYVVVDHSENETCSEDSFYIMTHTGVVTAVPLDDEPSGSDDLNRKGSSSSVLQPDTIAADGTKWYTLGDDRGVTDGMNWYTLGDDSGRYDLNHEVSSSTAIYPPGTGCCPDKPCNAPTSTYDGPGPDELYRGGPFSTPLSLNKVDADGTKWYTVFENKTLDLDFLEYGIKQDSMMYALMEEARDHPNLEGPFSPAYKRGLVLSSRFQDHNGCSMEATFFEDSALFRLSIAEGSYLGVAKDNNFQPLCPSPLRIVKNSSDLEVTPYQQANTANSPTMENFTFVAPPTAPKYPSCTRPASTTWWPYQILNGDLKPIPELEDKETSEDFVDALESLALD